MKWRWVVDRWQSIPQVYRYMLGGFILTLNSGLVNVAALLSTFKQPVSHMTGVTSNLAIGLANDLGEARFLSFIILSFVGGSAFSGLIINSRQLRFGRRYGVLLVFEGMLLLGALVPLKANLRLGYCLLAMACGLQNGLATFYSSAIVRTSHVTGLLTDLGILLGQALAGNRQEAWRWQMHFVLFVGFLSGGVVGAQGFGAYGVDVLLLAVFLTVAVGFGYWLWRQHLGARGGYGGF